MTIVFSYFLSTRNSTQLQLILNNPDRCLIALPFLKSIDQLWDRKTNKTLCAFKHLLLFLVNLFHKISLSWLQALFIFKLISHFFSFFYHFLLSYRFFFQNLYLHILYLIFILIFLEFFHFFSIVRIIN